MKFPKIIISLLCLQLFIGCSLPSQRIPISVSAPPAAISFPKKYTYKIITSKELGPFPAGSLNPTQQGISIESNSIKQFLPWSQIKKIIGTSVEKVGSHWKQGILWGFTGGLGVGLGAGLPTTFSICADEGPRCKGFLSAIFIGSSVALGMLTGGLTGRAIPKHRVIIYEVK